MDGNDELDPEIAELLGIDPDADEALPSDDSPPVVKPIRKHEILPIDFQKLIDDKNYYTGILEEAGEHGRRIHDLFTNFCKTEIKEEKSM